jgi:hypothetical protein
MDNINTNETARPPKQRYIGVKIVLADLMKLGAFNHFENRNMSGDQKADGYRVEYENGCRSWMPKEQFEPGNQLCDAMLFGHAIEVMKLDKKVARSEFAKGTYIRLIDPYSNDQYTVTEKDGMDGTLYPYFVIKTTEKGLVPWVPTDSDMLAKDWQIVE